MKVPVMIELFRQAEGRQLSSTTRSPSRTSSTASSTAASYQLSVGDDSDAEVYKASARR